ncbi:MAG: T9SS type A sorting domain-containing protein [Saprospiraceae bacterium]
MKYISRILLLCCLPVLAFSQLTNDGGTLTISANATIKVDGDFTNISGSTTTIEGTLSASGDIINQAMANLQGDGQYTLSGDWSNAGSFAAGMSTVTFEGSSASAVTSGGDVFFKIEMDKTAANLTLSDDLGIDELLEFLSNDNKIILSGNHLALSSAADILGYDETNFIVTDGTGELKKSALGAIAFTFPVGFDASTYNPLTLTQNGTADELGVRCLEHHFVGGNSGAQFSSEAVDASWEITEMVAGGSSLDATVQWTASDELSFNRSDCAIGFWDGSKWDYGSVPGSAAAGSDPFAQSRLTIGGVGVIGARSGAALPIELVDFQATAINETDAMLHWKTAAEIYSSHFEIERSRDGSTWQLVGKTMSKGQGSSEQDYEFLDQHVFDQRSQQALFYYRLKMVDLDGSFEYSPVRSVIFSNEKDFIMGKFFPNPVDRNDAGVQLEIYSIEEKEIVLNVHDVRGQLVARFAKQLTNRWQILTIDLGDLAAGIYQVKIVDGEEGFTQRIVVQ